MGILQSTQRLIVLKTGVSGRLKKLFLIYIVERVTGFKFITLHVQKYLFLKLFIFTHYDRKNIFARKISKSKFKLIFSLRASLSC